MWNEEYLALCTKEEIYGGIKNNGACDLEIEKLENEIQARFGIYISNELKDVYKVTTGFEANGYILYGIDEEFLISKPNHPITGIVYMNSIWKNGKNEDYLFLAHSDLSWFVYSISNEEYIELDMPSGTVIGTFSDIDDFLTKLCKLARLV